MRRHLLATFIPGAFFLLLIFGCTKIDTTTLGQDLIPDIDNVNTFADTIEITGDQGFFDDSTRIGSLESHPIGIIENDPVFGKTSADLYVQLKPSFFPFYFGAAGDTIANIINPSATETGFDSAVLCLSYVSFYGDTSIPQTLSVYQVDNNTTNFVSGANGVDSAYRINFTPNADLNETFLGSASVSPIVAANNVTHFPGSKKDTVTNQVRIKLNNSFLQYLITNRDSGANQPFHSDSLFKTLIKGFRVKAESGNGLFYVGLSPVSTRLEVHYKKVKNNVRDTAYSAFYFSTGTVNSVSAHAINIKRTWDGAEIKSPQPDALYIQSTPGTYARLTVPSLSTLNNRIIHRAEIVVEGIPSADPLDKSMVPPAYLYLDLVNDTGTIAGSKFKPVYYDLNPSTGYNPDNIASLYSFFGGTGIDYGSFGGYLRLKDTANGLPQYYYTFNVSRHLQHIVTNGVNNYHFRLYAPAKLDYYQYSFQFRNLIGDGRIEVGNGSHPQHKMYMRVVWSKL